MILPHHLASLPLKAVTKETGSVRTVAIKRIEGEAIVIVTVTGPGLVISHKMIAYSYVLCLLFNMTEGET